MKVNEITEAIIGAAIEVHRVLGPDISPEARPSPTDLGTEGSIAELPASSASLR